MLQTETFTVQVTSPMLYDKLYTLSVESSVPPELLINLAIKRLVEDVEFIRNLRIGKSEGV